MLWLCISLPQLPLEALQPDQIDTAVVVTACEGNTRWILCCNDAAERGNLRVPMNYTMALAIHPGLQMLNRKVVAEQTALERLAAWAYQFSSSIIIGEIPQEIRLARTACLWLEIGASLNLFGGLPKFIEQIESGMEQLGYTYQLGIGPTLEGAAVLARNGIRVVIATPHALFMRIRQLPIDILTLPPAMSAQLHAIGIRTIGMLLELPRGSIAKRFGLEISHFLDRLMGAMADPRPVFHLPQRYSAHFEFEFEIRNTQALLFPLRRMLAEFVGYLRARDTGTQRFAIEFGHRLIPATRIAIGSTAPDRNVDRFFALVRERMESLELPEPTLSLSICADEFASPTALQADLLNRSVHEAEGLSHTLDRLAARLGDENVHGLKLAADHRPEFSWTTARKDEPPGSLRFPERPLWLLPQPKELQLTAIPRITSGPERVEAGWWDDSDEQRDYYVVRVAYGPDLWVFRDLRNSRWYLHGFWS
jgi:protein ImuB